MREIVNRFGIQETADIEELKSGHINETYIVKSGDEKYIFQSLNEKVFKNPELIMNNIMNIEQVFAEKQPEKVTVPHYLYAGIQNFVRTDDKVWRMYRYIPEGEEIPDKYFLMGHAFGTFIRVTGNAVIESPEQKKGGRFYEHLEKISELSKNVGINKAIETKIFIENIFNGDLPMRNIHGDAKADNVIISEKCCTVIDLDTAMYGYAAVDYGDMIRSVSGISPDMEAVRDTTRGFAEGLGGILTSAETDSLYYGILWVTADLALRYFADYASEEGYFRDKTPAQCLRRTEELLSQLHMFRKNEREIQYIIHNVFGQN